VDRRAFIVALAGGLLAAPLAAERQSAANAARVGYLSPMSPTPEGLRFLDSLRQSLQERGYLDGQNITIEARWANGRYDRLPDLAVELVRLKVDVIVSMVTAASLAAKNATGTIPIVMVGVADPVDAGLVSSMARPGGNVTGTSSVAAEVAGKQLELLRDIVPGVSRVAVLWNPANLVFQTLQLRQTEAAAGQPVCQSLGTNCRACRKEPSPRNKRREGVRGSQRSHGVRSELFRTA
jgi:putative tryptophan/tyrosine transport system substrate-binding protein